MDAVVSQALPNAMFEVERLAAANVKRVLRPDGAERSPYAITALMELKTVWHPIGT